MNLKNLDDIPFFEGDACGRAKELFRASDGSFSTAYVEITGRARPHFHRVTREVYLVERGGGNITIGDETRPLRVGDIVEIPLNIVHYAERTSAEPLGLR